MSTTDSHAKNRGSKLTAAEKREAQLAANRKARMQWWILGALLVAIVLGAIIIISIVTEGELPLAG